MRFLIILTLFSANIFASDCSQFPSRSGAFVKDVYVKGLLVKIKANLEITSGVSFGTLYTSHTFQNPEFIIDGKNISVDSISAKEIFKELGYQHLEYKVQYKVKLLDFYSLLDSELRVRRARRGEYILQTGSPINAFHPVCSNWRY